MIATCPTGRFFVRGNLAFGDGTRMAGKVAHLHPLRLRRVGDGAAAN